MGDLLMSTSFFDVCKEEYPQQKSKKVFLQYLWNFRGIYLPLHSSIEHITTFTLTVTIEHHENSI